LIYGAIGLLFGLMFYWIFSKRKSITQVMLGTISRINASKGSNQ